MSRAIRSTLALCLTLSLAMSAAASPAAPATPSARPLVVTLDDGPSLAPAPRLDPAARHAALRDTLARHGVTAVMYVTLNFGANRHEGQALARTWGEAGHLLGNHTVTHPDLNDDRVPLDRYLEEITTCDTAMRTLPGWRRWFRATFLNEGHTEARRAGLRRHLADHGYRLAPVHLDSRDWAWAQRVQATLLDPQADAAALKAEFMAALADRARAARSQGTGPVVLLLHDTLLTALWLDDMLRLLKDQGYAFVHPDAAMAEAGPT